MIDEEDLFFHREPLDPIEEELMEDFQNTKKTLLNLEKSLKKELSFFREDMQRLIESLPDEKPSENEEGHAAFVRIESQIQEIKQKIHQKNTELMDIKQKISNLNED